MFNRPSPTSSGPHTVDYTKTHVIEKLSAPSPSSFLPQKTMMLDEIEKVMIVQLCMLPSYRRPLFPQQNTPGSWDFDCTLSLDLLFCLMKSSTTERIALISGSCPGPNWDSMHGMLLFAVFESVLTSVVISWETKCQAQTLKFIQYIKLSLVSEIEIDT